MKKFEQLKKSELEALRFYNKKDLWETWNDSGSRAYLSLRNKQNHSFVTTYFEFCREYPERSTNCWFVQLRFSQKNIAKPFSTLRAAWNAARKILKAVRKGDPKYRY